jgi:hypothetical protein
MTLNHHEMDFRLTIKEIGIWLVALRMAAKQHGVSVPWDANPFLQQHKELVRLTGYGTADHEELYAFLEKKAKEQGISSMKELTDATKKLDR